MATTKKNDFTGGFIVMNQAAVDLANHTAVLSVDTDVPVEILDGSDQFPLKSGDVILGPLAAAGAAGWAALEGGIAVQGCVYKSDGVLTMRTTNPSAGAVNPASIAANLMYFLVFRR